MLTKTLSEAKKKQRNILIKAMNNDIGSIDSAKDSWNPAQISERAKDISYIRSLVDSWNPAQLNEALKTLDLPVIDTWNPAQIEEQRRNLVFYLAERTLTGNPIKILGNLTLEVTGLKVTMNPIQDLHGYSNPWAGGAGKNKFDSDTVLSGFTKNNNKYVGKPGSVIGSYVISGGFKTNTQYTLSYKAYNNTSTPSNFRFIFSYTDETEEIIGGFVDTTTEKVIVGTSAKNKTISYITRNYGDGVDFTLYDIQLEEGSTATTFAPYSNICPISGRTEVSVIRTAGEDVETKTHQYSETIYGGVDDFVNGGLTNEWGYIASYDGETLPGVWISDRDAYAPNTTPTTGAEVAYKLATPTTIETTPEEITLLKGTNVLSTDGDSIELKYKQNF